MSRRKTSTNPEPPNLMTELQNASNRLRAIKFAFEEAEAAYREALNKFVGAVTDSPSPQKRPLRARYLKDAILEVFPSGENTATEVRDALLEHGWKFREGKTSSRQLVNHALWLGANSPNPYLEKTGRGLFRLKTK